MHRSGPDNRELIGGAYNNIVKLSFGLESFDLEIIRLRAFRSRAQGQGALDRLMAERQRRSQMLFINGLSSISKKLDSIKKSLYCQAESADMMLIFC